MKDVIFIKAYVNLNDEEFKIDSILTNYEMFLIHINSIYDDYKKAKFFIGQNIGIQK